MHPLKSQVTFDEGGNTKVDINRKKKRKPRPITSCDSCRRRKIGCANATLPCEPCILYGEECSLLPPDMTSGVKKPPEPRKTKPRKTKEIEVEASSQGRTASTGLKPNARGEKIENDIMIDTTIPPKKRPRKSDLDVSTRTVSLSPVSGTSSSTKPIQPTSQLNGQPHPSAVIHNQQQQRRSSPQVLNSYPRSQRLDQQPWQSSETRGIPYLSHLYPNTTQHNTTSGPSSGRLTHPNTHDNLPPTTQRRKRASFSHEASFLHSPSPGSSSPTGSREDEQAVMEEVDSVGAERAYSRKRSRSTGSMTSNHLAHYHTQFGSGGATDVETKFQVGVPGAIDSRRNSSSAIEELNSRSLFQAGVDGLLSSKISSEKGRALSFPNMSNSTKQQEYQQRYPSIRASLPYASIRGNFNSISSASEPFVSTSRSTLVDHIVSSDKPSVYITPHSEELSSIHRDNPSGSAFTYSQVHSSTAPPHFVSKSRMPESSYSILRDDLPSHFSPNVGYFSETTFQNPLLTNLTDRSRGRALNLPENQTSRLNLASHESSSNSSSGSIIDSSTQIGGGKDLIGASQSRILQSSSTLSGKKPPYNKKSTISSLAFLLQPWSPSNDKIMPKSRSPLSVPGSTSPALSSSSTTSVKPAYNAGGKNIGPMDPPPVPLHRRQHLQGVYNEYSTGPIIDLLKIPAQGKDEDRSKFEDTFKKSVGWILPWASDNLDSLGENARAVVWSLGARLIRWDDEGRSSSNGNLIALSKRYLHLVKARVAIESFFAGKNEEGIKGLETSCLIAWSESFSEDNESAWIWCDLALRLAENLEIYSINFESSPRARSLIASLFILSTLLSLRHCRPSIFPITLLPILPASHPAPAQDPLQAISHLLSLLTPLLPILHAAKTRSDVPNEASKTVGAVLKGVYDFWGEMKAEGGMLSLSTDQSQAGGKREKIESVRYGKKVLLETWVQGVFALLNSEDLLPPSILPDDHASEVALSATTSISTTLETISSLHHLRLAAISPLIDVPVQFALDLLKERAQRAKEAVGSFLEWSSPRLSQPFTAVWFFFASAMKKITFNRFCYSNADAASSVHFVTITQATNLSNFGYTYFES
ncbi:Zn(2)-C6 fungal-type DNA-binding domain [Phaffia rhodozyma]|uniref:Zn(2)-C6 fungal-type DNA-binding domain n=1 Tax=Phaffia rhodozyma TaxID=264483 RepID=A0A0F7SK36_PHARH|nr:Zn(2)-C6 fungal-type DNA-binding domain [Phaffia rhodozyma]